MISYEQEQVSFFGYFNRKKMSTFIWRRKIVQWLTTCQWHSQHTKIKLLFLSHTFSTQKNNTHSKWFIQKKNYDRFLKIKLHTSISVAGWKRHKGCTFASTFSWICDVASSQKKLLQLHGYLHSLLRFCFFPAKSSCMCVIREFILMKIAVAKEAIATRRGFETD